MDDGRHSMILWTPACAGVTVVSVDRGWRAPLHDNEIPDQVRDDDDGVTAVGMVTVRRRSIWSVEGGARTVSGAGTGSRASPVQPAAVTLRVTAAGGASGP